MESRAPWIDEPLAGVTQRHLSGRRHRVRRTFKNSKGCRGNRARTVYFFLAAGVLYLLMTVSDQTKIRLENRVSLAGQTDDEAIFKSINFWFKGWHFDIGNAACVPLAQIYQARSVHTARG